MEKPQPNPEKARLEALRDFMMRKDGLNPDAKVIDNIEPDWERICQFCSTPGPCTPFSLSCSYCGRNLAGSARSKVSQSFNPDAY